MSPRRAAVPPLAPSVLAPSAEAPPRPATYGPDPDHLPVAAWPVVVAERAAVAAARDRYAHGEAVYPPGVLVLGGAFPGAPLYAIANRDVPLPHDPSRLDGVAATPGGARRYAGGYLPGTVVDVLRALATLDEGTVYESGEVLRTPPGAAWPPTAAPVWLLALLRTVERLPIPSAHGAYGLGAWPTMMECVLAGVLCRITVEEWEALDAIRALTPTVEGKGLDALAPWPVYLSSRALVRALVVRHLPAYLDTQPATPYPLRHPGTVTPRDMTPTDLIAALRTLGTNDTATLYASFAYRVAALGVVWAGPGDCPEVGVRRMADTDVLWVSRVFDGCVAPYRPVSRADGFVLRGWSYPVEESTAAAACAYQGYPPGLTYAPPLAIPRTIPTAMPRGARDSTPNTVVAPYPIPIASVPWQATGGTTKAQAHAIAGAADSAEAAQDAWWCYLLWVRAGETYRSADDELRRDLWP